MHIGEVDGWPDPPENDEVQYNDDTYEKISFNSRFTNNITNIILVYILQILVNKSIDYLLIVAYILSF